MSAYQNLFNDVFDILENSTTILTVGEFNNQYDEDEIENYNLVKYPACYIENAGVEWDKNMNNFVDPTVGKEPQTGTAEIKVHVLFKTLKGFDKPTRNEFFSVIDHVSALLQKTNSTTNVGGNYSTLLRTAEEYVTPIKQLRVGILTFETKLKDNFPDNEYLIESGITMTLTNTYINY